MICAPLTDEVDAAALLLRGLDILQLANEPAHFDRGAKSRLHFMQNGLAAPSTLLTV